MMKKRIERPVLVRALFAGPLTVEGSKALKTLCITVKESGTRIPQPAQVLQERGPAISIRSTVGGWTVSETGTPTAAER